MTVLVVRPGEGPCLTCRHGTVLHTDRDVSYSEQLREAYHSEENGKEKVPIQVGLSADIVPVANMIVKIALLELSKGTSRFKRRPLPLGQSARSRISSHPEAGFQQYNVPSILRWYSVDFPRNPDCSDCRETNVPSSGFFGSP
eukprot:m.220428 g.220428  ORF g.220428 m.220428 type:complete len:143 (+) comp39939_c0_seq10:212-640(+)